MLTPPSQFLQRIWRGMTIIGTSTVSVPTPEIPHTQASRYRKYHCSMALIRLYETLYVIQAEISQNIKVGNTRSWAMGAPIPGRLGPGLRDVVLQSCQRGGGPHVDLNYPRENMTHLDRSSTIETRIWLPSFRTTGQEKCD